MTDKEKLDKLRQLGEKYKIATEYFDIISAGDYMKLEFLTKKLVNQIGREMLEIINAE